MSERLRVFLLVAAFVASLAALFGMQHVKEIRSETPSRMPEIALKNGGTLDSAVKGVAVVAIWGTWCPPCLSDHPVLMDMAKRGVRIVGVPVGDDELTVREWLSKKGNPYSELLFAGERIQGGIPLTLVVSDGRVVDGQRGGLSESDADRLSSAWMKAGGKASGADAALGKKD